MNIKTPYRFYEFWVPKREPFNGPNGWPAIIGEFIVPMVANQNCVYWFVQE